MICGVEGNFQCHFEVQVTHFTRNDTEITYLNHTILLLIVCSIWKMLIIIMLKCFLYIETPLDQLTRNPHTSCASRVELISCWITLCWVGYGLLFMAIFITCSCFLTWGYVFQHCQNQLLPGWWNSWPILYSRVVLYLLTYWTGCIDNWLLSICFRDLSV